ncbi:MAG: ATP-binding protein [Rikenellaceae bacterium]
MFIKILLIIAICTQLVASLYAIRLVGATKYSSIWWLFIMSFLLLCVERVLQFVMVGGREIPLNIFWWTGLVVSIGLSIGVMYAHRLFTYIERLNKQRQFISKRILSAVIRTEEKSRSTFSKELHDGLGPLLSTAKMSLSALSSQDISEKRRRKIIDDTTYIIDEAISSLREISNNLSPHVLNDFGLVRGLRNFIGKNPALGEIEIQFASNLKDERYDRDIEVTVYRTVCELFNNSLKHSGCNGISLSLLQEDNILRITYRDNGRGFSIRPVEDRGMGLSNISSRINSVSGKLEIESSEGMGMCARIWVPINEIKTNSNKDEDNFS